MFRYSMLMVIFALILSGCNPSTPVPTSVQPTRSLTKTPTFNPTSTKTQTPTPTITPLPSPTITPMTAGNTVPHKLALNEERAATEMIRLARYGQGTLYDIEWSPDGQYLAIATGLGVYLYDAITFEQVNFFDVNDDATAITFNPEGTFLAIARSNKIEIWDIALEQRIRQLEGEIEGGIWNLAYGKLGHIAAIGQIARGLGEAVPQLKVWNALSGSLIYKNDTIYFRSRAADISPDGTLIAFADEEGMAVRDIQTGNKQQDIIGRISATFSQDGTVIFATSDTKVTATNLTTGKNISVLGGADCQYLARNGAAAICYSETKVKVFNPANGKLIKTFEFPQEIKEVAINPDGNFLAIIKEDLISILNIQTEEEIKVLNFEEFETFATGMIYLDQVDYYVAATVAQNDYVQIWDLKSGKLLREFQAGENNIEGLVFSPDRRTLALLDGENSLKLWDIQDSVIMHSFNLDMGAFFKVFAEPANAPLVFSTDGLKLGMTDVSQANIYEFDLQSGSLNRIGGRTFKYPYAKTFRYGWYASTPDNRWLTLGQNEENILLMDLGTYETINLPYKLEADASFVETIALSSDGNILATGLFDGKILIWDLRNQRIIQSLAGHELRSGDGWSGATERLVFNPRTNLLVSVGWDGTTRLWDIHSGRQLRLLEVCCRADFSPDGRLLITEGNGVIRVWGVPPWP
ncbi:MAG: WD40 repeat domain-containing protein [Chloroflexi bacterium]|nr:WD40 repeat domain-containing protein [Chloroflexota bacterium]